MEEPRAALASVSGLALGTGELDRGRDPVGEVSQCTRMTRRIGKVHVRPCPLLPLIGAETAAAAAALSR